MRYQKKEDGDLAYKYGVILNYLFNMEDLEKNLNSNLVVHVVDKVPYINLAGEKIKPEKYKNGYKFKYYFDMVHMMDNCLAYEVVREKELIKIKNKTGVDSGTGENF
ncbi:MAG: hypothetical protein V8R90_00245 [Eubacterium sp.]